MVQVIEGVCLQKIPQLRICCIDSCNRECIYCRPAGESMCRYGKGSFLAIADMVAVARAYIRLGGSNVKLTGGDPALRNDLPECVERLRKEAGVPSLEIITRHPRFASIANDVAKAGATALNISIDTIVAKKHQLITGVDDLAGVLDSLYKCIETGLPVKVNAVLMKGVNEDEVANLISFCENRGVSELKLLDIIKDLEGDSPCKSKRLSAIGHSCMADLYLDCSGVYAMLDSKGHYTVITQSGLGHPMRQYLLSSGLKVTVKDFKNGAWYNPSCRSCSHYPCHDALMALRLTPERKLQFCLLNGENSIDIAAALGFGEKSLDQAMETVLSYFSSAELKQWENA